MTTERSREEIEALLARLQEMAARARTDAEVRIVTSQIAKVTRDYRIRFGVGFPAGPLEQAIEIDSGTASRPHLTYLSRRIAKAVRDVERGKNRQLAISMPPRHGKSELLSVNTPVYILRRHPEWKILSSSHESSLTVSWAKGVRSRIEENPSLGISLARDGGKVDEWETIEGGGLLARSVRSGITGRGARVMIIDDPIRDFVEAHSTAMRNNLWNWWLSVAQTRLEPPYLVLVVATRWHEDDMIGRLLSDEWEGDPKRWERISVPALAEEDDALGRNEGDPLYSPIIPNETREEALLRFEETKENVGTYTFSAMYQQRPAPAKGAVFDSGWWRFWTMDERRATEDGRVVWLDPSSLTAGKWCDSWDMSFKSVDTGTGGWVVGQRWVRDGANRYLISQQRGRWTFTMSLAAMGRWAINDDPAISPCGHLVHTRLIEDRANGTAIMDVLQGRISGLKPINPTISKVARAHAVTPEIESGNVYLPHPSDPGNEWVGDYLSELRNFPNDAADDQVDTTTQALSFLRDLQGGSISVPGHRSLHAPMPNSRNTALVALNDLHRPRLGGPSRPTMPTIRPRRPG